MQNKIIVVFLIFERQYLLIYYYFLLKIIVRTKKYILSSKIYYMQITFKFLLKFNIFCTRVLTENETKKVNKNTNLRRFFSFKDLKSSVNSFS